MIFGSLQRVFRHLGPLSLAFVLRMYFPCILTAGALSALPFVRIWNDPFADHTASEPAIAFELSPELLLSFLLILAFFLISAMVFTCIFGNFAVRAHRILSTCISGPAVHLVRPRASIAYGLLTLVVLIVLSLSNWVSQLELIYFERLNPTDSVDLSWVLSAIVAALAASVMVAWFSPWLYWAGTGRRVRFSRFEVFVALIFIELIRFWALTVPFHLLAPATLIHSGVLVWMVVLPIYGLFAIWLLAVITVAGDEATESR